MINKPLLGAVAVLVALYSAPLASLFGFALHSELYSHIILVPFVSIYFGWLTKHKPAPSVHRQYGIALVASGLALVVCSFWLFGGDTANAAVEDRLATPTFAFVLSMIAAVAWFTDRDTLRALAFPLFFLFAMVPFPTVVREGIETFYQHTSASAAAGLFTIARTPFFHDGTFFQLPGINLEVAPECSGIRSSLALFLTSLVAGQLFLDSPIKRVFLALFVIPLGIVRNGFRIFTIGKLCVHVGPHMIDSPIHHRGGPIFFALSLIPFGIVLYILVRMDQKHLRTVKLSQTVAAQS